MKVAAALSPSPGCSLDVASPSHAWNHSPPSVGGSYGTARMSWLLFDVGGGVVWAECCYFAHRGASRDGGEGCIGGEDGGDDGDADDAAAQQRGRSHLGHDLGGGRHSNCRYSVLQRWQTFQWCFLDQAEQLDAEDSGL